MATERELGVTKAREVEPFWEQRTEGEKGARDRDALLEAWRPVKVAAGAYGMPRRDQGEPQPEGVKTDPDNTGLRGPSVPS